MYESTTVVHKDAFSTYSSLYNNLYNSNFQNMGSRFYKLRVSPNY